MANINEENKLLEERFEELKRLDGTTSSRNAMQFFLNTSLINKILFTAINYPSDLVNSVSIGLLFKNPKNNGFVLSERSKDTKESIYNSIPFLDKLFNINEPTLSKKDIELLKNSGIPLDNLISTYLNSPKPLKIIKHLPYTFGALKDIIIRNQRRETDYFHSCMPVMLHSTIENKLSGKRLDSKEPEKLYRFYLSINSTSYLLRKGAPLVDMSKFPDIIFEVPIKYVNSVELSNVSDDKFTPLLKKEELGKDNVEFEKPITPGLYHQIYKNAERNNEFLPLL